MGVTGSVWGTRPCLFKNGGKKVRAKIDCCSRAEMYAQVKNEMKHKVGKEPEGSKKRSCAGKEGSFKISL